MIANPRKVVGRSERFNKIKTASSLVILFCGPDGAGKSTQVGLLVDFLKNHGVKTKKVWIRATHSIAFLISKFLIKKGYFRTARNPQGRTLNQLSLNKSGLLKRLWPYVEFISLLPWVILRVKIPRALGYAIVAERYTLDSVASIAYKMQDSQFLSSFIGRLLLKLIPKESIIINLDCDYCSILKRRGLQAESEDFIQTQRKIYALFSEALNILTIDTSSSGIDETHETVLRHISERLRLGHGRMEK